MEETHLEMEVGKTVKRYSIYLSAKPEPHCSVD